MTPSVSPIGRIIEPIEKPERGSGWLALAILVVCACAPRSASSDPVRPLPAPASGTGGDFSLAQPGAGKSSAAPSVPDTATSWTIVSPGDVVRATIELSDKGGTSGFPAGERLYYTVRAGGPSAYTTVMEASPLGITRSDRDFVEGLSLHEATAPVLSDESYTMLTGKKSHIRNAATTRVLMFRSGASMLALELRAHDTGFAFRYRFPESSTTPHTVTGEATGFALPAGSRAWMLPYDAAGMYTPAYESYWQSDIAAGTPSSPAPGWCFPALFRTPSNHWLLLGDTDVSGTYFAAHLEATAAGNVYRIALPLADEANGLGSTRPVSTLPWTTAWRMVIAGPSPAAIVESTLATDLARPSVVAGTSWIRPGRASWSWWINDSNPTSYAANTAFVDLAQAMTWEYSLIDAGWQEMAGGRGLRELQAYAAARDVGLLLWYNSGGPHNSVSVLPRDRMHDAPSRRAELQSIQELGVRGIKVDFFHSDKPWMMQYFEELLRDAAEFQLLANFHGATIPRGWQRTYPHLMTAEAVRGAEMYKYDGDYPAEQARRNTLLPFTRNAVASMDFTPVTFTNQAHPHVTTFAHELALSVVFESGIQHFADQVSAYASLPPGPRSFLQKVPVAWDDTRYVEGIPGQWVVLARRKGSRWYVAGIGGDAQARELSLTLSFLGTGDYDAVVISDGASSTSFAQRAEVLTAASALAVSLSPRGGFVATLTPRAGAAPRAP